MHIFYRYQSLDPNPNALGFAMILGILHESGQADTCAVYLTNAHSDQDVQEACDAAVSARMAAEFPQIEVASIRRLP